MAKVKFTKALKRFFPTLGEYDTHALTLPQMFQEINTKYPGIINYILDEQGHLRKHVNVFINGAVIDDRLQLTDLFEPDDEIYIIQALSGG